MIPSAESSCILVQADTIFMASWNTVEYSAQYYKVDGPDLVHHQHSPLYLPRLLVVPLHRRPDHVVHDTCTEEQ